MYIKKTFVPRRDIYVRIHLDKNFGLAGFCFVSGVALLLVLAMTDSGYCINK
jgi:hypothetical protein